MKKLTPLLLALVTLLSPLSLASTQVPGHERRSDRDGNGFPDAGVYVNGHYRSVYAYDATGDYYWDLGDGRILGTVASVDALDQATLTVCEYNVTYRADFGNDAFMNCGWEKQQIVCRGYDYPKGPGVYMYLIVHKTDPRYTGDPDWAVWGDWEYFAFVESGSGNLPRMAKSGIE